MAIRSAFFLVAGIALIATPPLLSLPVGRSVREGGIHISVSPEQSAANGYSAFRVSVANRMPAPRSVHLMLVLSGAGVETLECPVFVELRARESLQRSVGCRISSYERLELRVASIYRFIAPLPGPAPAETPASETTPATTAPAESRPAESAPADADTDASLTNPSSAEEAPPGPTVEPTAPQAESPAPQSEAGGATPELEPPPSAQP
ncbi:MAG: hypothetical protein K1X75_01535 [Leptospirales bacterium]|nr:hypothetical protein [Leptospirales bacterium]